MKVTTSLISKVSTLLGLTSRVVAESLGVIKPNRKKIAVISTTEDVLDAIGKISEFDSEESELLYKQCDILSAKEVRLAKALKQLKKAHLRARNGSGPRRSAIRKIAKLLKPMR